ncbi:hypothetical protein R1flu_026667 [Riccia fluitans]|uniref:PGG domain-containing protein n=1 Tax=Riccia fluitans TaxID=41844 RepID=A0ABD1XGK4_9MARC
MQGAGTDVSSSTFEILRTRLLCVVGYKDRTRQIVTEYPLNEIPHDEYIDKELQLNILHIVAMAGDLDSVKELRSQGRADPRAKTVGGFSAVHLAASRGHIEAVKELVGWLTLQSDTEAGISNDGFTPLHLATYGGYSETVMFLLADNHYSVVNAQEGIFGRTALHYAVLAGHETIVEMLMGVDGINVRLTDRVGKLTPLLLAAMHPKDEDGSRLRMVKMLLDKNAQQINDKVELSVFSGVRIRDSFTESLQKLTLIECDSSVDQSRFHDLFAIADAEAKAEESEADAYRRCAVPMDGHTALHLAATQNNAELVSELSCRPGVSLNIRDTTFGMTPLHCAIRVGAMQTFEALMGIDGVNVNARLVKGGPCQLPSCNWIPPRSSFVTKERAKHKLFEFFERFDRLETPLHLAVHVCRAEDLSEMVLSFCSHPNFNGAVHNGYRKTSLELVWERLGYCGKLPSVFTVRRKESQDPQIRVVEKYLYEDKVHLSNAIDLLKRHPTNACVLAEKEGIQKAALDSVNTFLVTATLLAGLTFSAYLQPPIGTHDEEHTRKSVKLFWVFNSLSFFFAVYTILTSLFHSIHDQSNEIIFSQRDLVHVGIVRVQGAVPLTLSVGFGIMAFVAAGYANVPSDSKQLMTTCTIGGLLLVLSQLLQNLFHSFVQLRESYSLLNPPDSEQPKYTLEDDRFLLLTALFGPVLFFRLRILRILELCSRGNKIVTQIGSEVERISLMSSPIPHMCIAAAVILYALGNHLG